MDGLAWLCKSGFREEFVLGKGVMHGAIGLEHLLEYFFSPVLFLSSTILA